jgi:hypothetical protein
MKGIYLIIIVYIVASCNSGKNAKAEMAIPNSIIGLENESAEDSTRGEAYIEKLILPVMGTFELNKTKTDSLNEYGAGDCWGTIRRYTLPDAGLAIDSMSCGEYGFTYSYYLLSTNDLIQVVYSKKSESILNPESDSYFYVQQEKVIDFNSDPAIYMERTDTVYDYKSRNNHIKKKFVTETLKDKQTSYENLEGEYLKTWQRKLEY